jgi:hypothetical protein
MLNQVVDQSEQAVQLIRFGPSTNRPHSPPQPLWQGEAPQGVKAILTRDALAEHLRDWYAKWAANFALLTDGFLAQVFERELSRIKQLERGQWEDWVFFDWQSCKVGDAFLWAQKHDHGWTVELCYPDTDPDVRILTIQGMPVLCREGVWAARLALACYPKAPANLVWHSYW